MTRWTLLMIALWLAPAAAVAAMPSQSETITAIQVHGNTATPDEEIRNLTGVQVGMPVEAATVDEVAARLRATKRFEHVEVLKRFASISDPTQIVLVVIVDEGAVHIETTGDDEHPVRAVKSRGPRLMFLPILSFEDGYGFTYGAQLAKPDPLGAHSRLSFPLTWGGQKQAAVEVDKTLEHGPLDRITGGAGITGRTNPFYEIDDNRDHLWARGERTLVPHLRVGVDGGWQHVSFGTLTNSYGDVGADVIWDTRLDPMLARNAVYAKARWNHLGFGASQTELDARGYLGFIGQSILTVRAQSVTSDQAMPPYLQPLLGGTANLRGFSAGTSVGDNLVALTGELILPLTSPLHVGKLGVSAFTDAGTVWDYGARLADQSFKHDYGGSVWVSAAFFRLRLAVAHGVGASTRVAVDASLTF